MRSEPLLTVAAYDGLQSDAGSGALRLERGELVLVRGASGAGKSRFLRRLIDLDPEPRGDMRLAGTPVGRIPPTELRRRIGYVAQDPVRFRMTGRELIARVRALAANAGRCAPAATIDELMTALGVAAIADRPMSEYSGGENRRFALVVTLQLQPEVLLLDEPTAGLDAERITGLLEVLAGYPELAMLMVTHEIPAALSGRPEARITEP